MVRDVDRHGTARAPAVATSLDQTAGTRAGLRGPQTGVLAEIEWQAVIEGALSELGRVGKSPLG